MQIVFHPHGPTLIQWAAHAIKIRMKFKDAIIQSQGTIYNKVPWLFDKQARNNENQKAAVKF